MLTASQEVDLHSQLFYTVNSITLSLKIFLIDDDLDEAELFSEALKTIEVASDLKSFSLGTEALQYIVQENHVPDCIFLDLNMPLISGKDVLYQLRKAPITKNLRVIVYSTTISPKDVEDTKEFNVEYLQKPSDFETLCKMVRQLLVRPS